MQAQVRERVLEATGATAIAEVIPIQALWNNYGTLSRVTLTGCELGSVIVKHIQVPPESAHPRGFTGSIGRRRKVRSYRVEKAWYTQHNIGLPEGVATPACLDAHEEGTEFVIILEDLAGAGYPTGRSSAAWHEVVTVLGWLARFHAHFVGSAGEGLWPNGTYWHLETRPEELQRIHGTPLHRYAAFLDARLRSSPYSTVVHGDAKLANFCFSEDGRRVAAVDFQYVGRGCAMKDVAYFVGSCMSGDACEAREEELLTVYFAELRRHLNPKLDGRAVEDDLRGLYEVAWADFERFMLGWSPDHWKLSEYSERLTRRALTAIEEELLDAARGACNQAALTVTRGASSDLDVESKGHGDRASDVVTRVDREAERVILEALRPSSFRYELGLLSEERGDDRSRRTAHAFWAVDPLDGTRHFVEGRPGYAVSVALVSQEGEPLIGVVRTPATGDHYEAVAGRGVFLNGAPLAPAGEGGASAGRLRWYADSSLQQHPRFERVQERFDVSFPGGAVTNALHVLSDPRGVYIKPPRDGPGGCAIWDLAAVTLMIREVGGSALTFAGEPLGLNPPESEFLASTGFILTGSKVDPASVLRELGAIP